jgi:hypothetical protein
MIQCIEHFSSELNLETLSYLESLNEPEVHVPIMWCGENVSTITILSGRRNAEGGSRILATRKCRRGGKENRPKEGLPRQVL